MRKYSFVCPHLVVQFGSANTQVAQHLWIKIHFYMKRFFPNNNNEIPDPEPGASSLEGPYRCEYCGQSHAQEDRFQIYVPTNDGSKIVGKGTFCLPECAAAYNLYMTTDLKHAEYRHGLIEKQAGRRVFAAPPPRVMRGMERSMWVNECRWGLNEVERRIGEVELTISDPRSARKG
jgi:hypothetical protein